MYQNGLTMGRAQSEDSAALRSWLESADGATSIAYRIEGLDTRSVFPRVLTAVPVETSAGPGWALAHCISIQDSLLVARREFVDDDCPRIFTVLRPESTESDLEARRRAN